MSDKFEITLRSKSAEQLINMSNNKTAWSTDQALLIRKEIKKRGLELFEDPQPWDEQEMNNLNLDAPESDFEQDMATIIAHEEKHRTNSNLTLAAQIIAIASIGAIFLVTLFIPLDSFNLFTITAITAFFSIALFLAKKYLISIILGVTSLVINAVLLLLFLKEIL